MKKRYLLSILFLLFFATPLYAVEYVWDSFEGDCAGGACGTFDDDDTTVIVTSGSNTCAVEKIPIENNPTGVGDYALKSVLAANGSTAFAEYDMVADKDLNYTLEVIYIDDLPSAGNVYLSGLYDDGTSAYVTRYYITSDGSLYYCLYDGGESCVDTGTNLSVDTWYVIRVNYRADGTDDYDLVLYSIDNGVFTELDTVSDTVYTEVKPDRYHVGITSDSAAGTATVYTAIVGWESEEVGFPGTIKQKLDPTGPFMFQGWDLVFGDGTLLHYDGFDSPSWRDCGYSVYKGWDHCDYDGYSGAPNPNYTADVKHGSECCRGDDNGDGNERSLESGLASGGPVYDFYAHFWFKILSYGNSAPQMLISFLTTSDAHIVNLWKVNSTTIGVGIYNPAFVNEGTWSLSTNTWYRCEIEWHENQGTYGSDYSRVRMFNEAGSVVSLASGDGVSTGTNFPSAGLAKAIFPISEASADTFDILMDDLIIVQDGDYQDEIGDISVASLLSDSDDTTYIEIDASPANSYSGHGEVVALDFEDPDSDLGSIKEVRYFYKGRNYGSNWYVNKITPMAWYSPDDARWDSTVAYDDEVTWYRWYPRFLQDGVFQWRYEEFFNDPIKTITYTNVAGSFETDLDIGDEIYGDVTFAKFAVLDYNTTANTIVVGRLDQHVITASPHWVPEGAGYSFYPGEELNYVTGGTGTADVTTDWAQSALSWTTVDDFRGGLRPLKDGSFNDGISEGGGRISEVYLETVSTEDSAEYCVHFRGTGAAHSEGMSWKGRTTGPAYVRIRFGLTHNDVIDNNDGTNKVYTTAWSSLTSSGDDYSWQYNLVGGTTQVYDEDGVNSTFDISSFRGHRVYYDVHVRGQNAPTRSWVSLHHMEQTSNPIYLDVMNDATSDAITSTIFFPTTSSATNVIFHIVADNHSGDYPKIWDALATDMYDATFADCSKFIIDTGDEVRDGGDILKSLRLQYQYCSGFSGGRNRMKVMAKYPFFYGVSDHDGGGDNDTNKIGQGFYEKTMDAGGTVKYYRIYNALKVNKEFKIWNHQDDLKFSYDYLGNEVTDITDLDKTDLDGYSDDNTLIVTSGAIDFDDPLGNYFVHPGTVVHCTDTDGTYDQHSYTIVKTVSNQTLEMTSALRDKFKIADHAFDIDCNQIRISRAGTWQRIRHGRSLDIFLLDRRYRADLGLTPGNDWADGTTYLQQDVTTGLGAKVSGSDDNDSGDAFVIHDAGLTSGDFTKIREGDAVIVDTTTDEEYAHITSYDSVAKTLTLNNDIGNTAYNYYIFESGGSKYTGPTAIADAHAAGHVQRSAFEEYLNKSDSLAKLLASEMIFTRNEAGGGDVLADTDGVSYGSESQIIDPVNPEVYSNQLLLDSESGTFNDDSFLKGSTSGAIGKIATSGVDTTTYSGKTLITFVTNYTSSCWDPDTPEPTYPYQCSMMGEFKVGETITEYTDAALTTPDATAVAQAPPSGVRFTATDVATHADFNRFWKGSISRGYFLEKLKPFDNIFQVGGDRHYHALDSGCIDIDNASLPCSHSDEPYPAMDSGPCQYGNTWVTGSWMIDSDLDHFGEFQTEYSAYGTLGETEGSCKTGGFGRIDINYGSLTLDMTIKDHTGTTFASTCGTNLKKNLTQQFALILENADAGRGAWSGTWGGVWE